LEAAVYWVVTGRFWQWAWLGGQEPGQWADFGASTRIVSAISWQDNLRPVADFEPAATPVGGGILTRKRSLSASSAAHHRHYRLFAELYYHMTSARRGARWGTALKTGCNEDTAG